MQQNLTSTLRAARHRKGLTQDALAARIGVTKSAVSAWEAGREQPQSSRLAAIDDALRPHLNLRAFVRELAGPATNDETAAA